MSKNKCPSAVVLVDNVFKEVRDLDRLVWNADGQHHSQHLLFEPLINSISHIRSILGNLHIILAKQFHREPKPHSVMIVFGREDAAAADEGEFSEKAFEENVGKICKYRFATVAEYKAFLIGVDESNGFLDWRTVKITGDGKVLSYD